MGPDIGIFHKFSGNFGVPSLAAALSEGLGQWFPALAAGYNLLGSMKTSAQAHLCSRHPALGSLGGGGWAPLFLKSFPGDFTVHMGLRSTSLGDPGL